MSVGVMEDYKLRDLRASHTLGWSREEDFFFGVALWRFDLILTSCRSNISIRYAVSQATASVTLLTSPLPAHPAASQFLRRNLRGENGGGTCRVQLLAAFHISLSHLAAAHGRAMSRVGRYFSRLGRN